MKKNSIWRFLWVSGIFLILIVIYRLVIIYKVEWETRDFNTYLYFYNCGDKICSSITKPKISYKKIVCEDDECPYITDYWNDILILSNNNVSWLYDYKSGEIFDNKYQKYEILSDGLFIIIDENLKQGIMDDKGNVLIVNKYNDIVYYGYGMLVYKDNNLYGIDYISGEKIISPKYDDVIVLNNTLYAGKLNGKYQIYSVVNNALKSNAKYDYVWSNGNVILVIKDKQIDILNNMLDSNLLMKINTSFAYNTKAEIKTLNIHYDNNYIYFNVYRNSNDYTEYKYNFIDKKISTNK